MAFAAGVGNSKSDVTQLPAPNSQAAGWDRTLSAAYGNVLGAEMRGKGANVALGPTLDLASGADVRYQFGRFMADHQAGLREYSKP